MDDEPMWAADRVVALTPDSGITIPETIYEFAIKGNHLTLVKGNQFDGSSKFDTDKIMALMDAMTMKKDAQYKELQSRPKEPIPDHNDDNTPLSREEEAKFMQTFHRSSSKPYQPPQARNEKVNAVFMRSGKSYDPPINPNDQPNDFETHVNFDRDDEDEEPRPQPKPKDPKPVKESSTPKPYKPKIPYPQHLIKKKIEAQYGKFLNMIQAVRINVPLVGVLAGMPNYGKFLKELVSNRHKLEQILDAFLSDKSSTLIQTKFHQNSETLEVFLFHGDMSFILSDAVIRVKAKQLNLGVEKNRGEVIDVIEEILEEYFDALLDEGSKTLYSIEGTILEDKRWRVCIDYRKLDEATTKYHFPLPFIDQMLERLTGNKYVCFLDGFSSYFKIQVDPMDQEKTTFTCPFGTYAYRRMPFGLCNALATFQRCVLAIFHDMIKESIEVFMDDFSVFGNSFDYCLKNLDKMLQCCKDASLVLNWEKYHFMVEEEIMLGYKLSSVGLEVDKAKINIISKLPPPTNVKGIRSFLGHAEIDIKIKDKKGVENVAVDHLSRNENDETSDDNEVDDNFLGETLMEITTNDTPWFANFANYLVGDVIPKGMTYQQNNIFFTDLKNYFWEDPYLFKVCLASMIKRCVSGPETRTILDQCHHRPTTGHYRPNTTAKKVLDSGFYWPTIIKEAHTLVCICEAC
ncbi:reverse transcriptase domain-containing protein [Tanacetum coccineum]